MIKNNNSLSIKKVSGEALKVPFFFFRLLLLPLTRRWKDVNWSAIKKEREKPVELLKYLMHFLVIFFFFFFCVQVKKRRGKKMLMVLVMLLAVSAASVDHNDAFGK